MSENANFSKEGDTLGDESLEDPQQKCWGKKQFAHLAWLGEAKKNIVGPLRLGSPRYVRLLIKSPHVGAHFYGGGLPPFKWRKKWEPKNDILGQKNVILTQTRDFDVKTR